MFFVIGTGRCGTKTVARLLSQHPLGICLHEPHPQLIKLATDYRHGLIDDLEMKWLLTQILPHRMGIKLYGESNHKLSLIIIPISQLYPCAKFIWLIRDGRDVVASFYARGAYGPEDEIRAKQEDIGIAGLYFRYRLRGDLVGEIDRDTWERMSPFEKCCWYWHYVNSVIEVQLHTIDRQHWTLVRIEEIEIEMSKLLQFLDLPYFPLSMGVYNKSNYPTYSFRNWNDEERYIFEKWCGDQMERYYPHWRSEDGEWIETAKFSGLSQTNMSKIPRYIMSIMKWYGQRSLLKVSELWDR